MPDTGSMKFTPADIDESAGAPLYQQIYDLLRARIMDGTLALNDRLPAEQDLTKALGVSRITVKRAMNELAEAQDMPSGSSVQRIVRLRSLDGEPFSYLVTYIPYDIADGYDDKLLATESLIKLLEKAGHAPVEAEQTITATSAAPAVAANLGVAPGSPLLRIHRIMKDKTGRPVQDITAHYRADRFEYHMRLNRANATQSDWKTEK